MFHLNMIELRVEINASEVSNEYVFSNVDSESLSNESKMISGMRQVWFATAMCGNKYQGRLTIDFTTKEPTQDCNCDHRIVPFF